jgi:sodium transport system permease protein
MKPGRRIGTIYAKELIELLRDRRTLIAMIVVPIALYPLLIVGSVHLLSIRDQERKITPLVIAVPDGNAPENVRETHAFLKWAFEQVRADLQSRAESAEDPADINAELENIAKLKLQPVTHVANAVTHGGYLVGVEMQRAAGEGRENAQLIVTPYYDKAEVPSDAALRRVVRVLEAVNRIKQERMIAQWGIPQAVLEPVRIDAVSVASPKKVGGMVLGTIVPLVLVLMTITGAIYPAIDLTAGERERGTLETLIACPVPPVEVITGKYLVVATVAMLGAALNLASVGATLYFGGFTKLLDTSGQTELPLGVLPVILVALVPFALLFSAIMVAVCSYARTFKEAQNYIVPVILAALIPGGVAALPGTEFGGVNTVVPVMNMVLMARELLLGNYDWPAIALVLVSTSLYAGVSVIIASRVFSTEAAVFADSASLRSVFVRRLIQPARAPSLTLALIVTAVLFPLWMFVQFAIQPGEDGSLLDTFLATARYMPVFLVALPVVLLVYFKIRVRAALALGLPRMRYVLAAILLGLTAWAPAHELFLLQGKLIPLPQAIIESNAQIMDAFAGRGLIWPLLLIAVIPAVCEELFFRGFLFAGLRTPAGKWLTIIVTACVFAVFHIMLIKFVLTASLGVALGYLRWQSRSIWPSIVAHLLHNASAVALTFVPAYRELLGVTDLAPDAHLPAGLIAAGCVGVAVAIFLAIRPATDQPEPHPLPATTPAS